MWLCELQSGEVLMLLAQAHALLSRTYTLAPCSSESELLIRKRRFC
jgi:hypothetical protein